MSVLGNDLIAKLVEAGIVDGSDGDIHTVTIEVPLDGLIKVGWGSRSISQHGELPIHGPELGKGLSELGLIPPQSRDFTIIIREKDVINIDCNFIAKPELLDTLVTMLGEKLKPARI